MPVIKEKLSQSLLLKEIATRANTTVLVVKDVLQAQASITEDCLKKGGVGNITLPFINVKLRMKHRPARKAGKGMSFGKEVMLPARKAETLVKAMAGKKLKDMVNY